MATWLAVVGFPDGSTQYAQYSTVVGSLLDGLYPDRHLIGDRLPDGSQCYRAQPAGEPLAANRDAAPSPPEQLVPVQVRCHPDDEVWHAVYCPSRRLVLGPLSWHHHRQLQERFDVVLDEVGVRHLIVPGTGVVAWCGSSTSGTRLPFHTRVESFGSFDTGPSRAEPPPNVPDIDLFADWATGTVCRSCLLDQLHP